MEVDQIKRYQPEPSGSGSVGQPFCRPDAGFVVGLLLVAMILALVGCGASAARAGHSAPASICTRRARSTVARFLDVSASRVSVLTTTANSGYPECDFTARNGRDQTVKLSVEVSTAPQAYAVLERAAEEAAQIFGPVRLSPAPQDITGLGIDAQWFPEEQHLMTTDGIRLITATVIWPAAPQSRRRALAQAAARPYLGLLDFAAAKPIGP